jgi:cell shape-determining protein MreC
MKKLIFIITAIIFGSTLAVAQQQEGELKSARKNIASAQADLKQAKKDSIAEYYQFKTESFAQIDENNKTIEALKAEKLAREKAATERYLEKVKSLEAQNTELKESVVNYRADGNTNWVSFKREFNRKMQLLRQSFLDSRD